MMDNPIALENETGFDRVLRFTIPDQNCRGRLLRLGPAAETILSAHDYSPPIKMLLCEALVLTALMGALLKGDEDQLTFQIQTKSGIIELLVCDYRAGALRGYIQHDPDRVRELGANPELQALLNEGYLAITFDISSSGQRYQGIVPLEGPSLSAAVEAYFAQSEQIPTLIRTGVKSTERGCVAGGILIQHLAEGEQGRERLHVRMDHPEWEHVSILANTVRHAELTDAKLSLEALVWHLFHEEREIRVDSGDFVTRGCRCSERHLEDVLSRFPSQDRKDMRDDDGLIKVDCAFCSKVFVIQD